MIADRPKLAIIVGSGRIFVHSLLQCSNDLNRGERCSSILLHPDADSYYLYYYYCRWNKVTAESFSA
eukprot:2262524-Amphidinium_carterae.1